MRRSDMARRADRDTGFGLGHGRRAGPWRRMLAPATGRRCGPPRWDGPAETGQVSPERASADEPAAGQLRLGGRGGASRRGLFGGCLGEPGGGSRTAQAARGRPPRPGGARGCPGRGGGRKLASASGSAPVSQGQAETGATRVAGARATSVERETGAAGCGAAKRGGERGQDEPASAGASRPGELARRPGITGQDAAGLARLLRQQREGRH